MSEFLVIAPSDAIGALPVVMLGLGSSLKKLVKSVGNIGQKIIDVHKNVAKKIEQTARPVTKLAAVAAATYYGGPMGGQLAAQLAFRPKGSPQDAASVPYTEYAAPYDARYDAGVMGGIYPSSYPLEATGAPLGAFSGAPGGDVIAPRAGIPPIVYIAGGGVLLILFGFLIFRK